MDIRRAFDRFTNGKLTFSAGIGLFDSKCPMAEMARQSGALESAAKSLPEKDGIALFGVPDSESNKSYEVAVYKWQDFTENLGRIMKEGTSAYPIHARDYREELRLISQVTRRNFISNHGENVRKVVEGSQHAGQ